MCGHMLPFDEAAGRTLFYFSRAPSLRCHSCSNICLSPPSRLDRRSVGVRRRDQVGETGFLSAARETATDALAQRARASVVTPASRKKSTLAERAPEGQQLFVIDKFGGSFENALFGGSAAASAASARHADTTECRLWRPRFAPKSTGRGGRPGFRFETGARLGARGSATEAWIRANRGIVLAVCVPVPKRCGTGMFLSPVQHQCSPSVLS